MMLKILGSFKVVPDLELLSNEEWIADEDLLVDTSYVKTIWNCFDESALEMMLKLSDSSEGFNVITQLDALTIGNAIGDSYLKTLYALGYSKATRIACEERLLFQPERTAQLIAEYENQRGGHNIIMMGNRSADADNRKVPLLVAEYLKWPCITQVIDVKPVNDEYVEVQSISDNGVLQQKVKVPCVLAVGSIANSYLRVPTLKNRTKLGKRPVEICQMDELIQEQELFVNNKIELVSMEYVEVQRAGTIIEGTTTKEKAKKLYEEYLKERWT